MTSLVAASLLFIVIHLLVSGTTLRDRIVGAIGDRPYSVLFSVTSLIAVVWMCIAYNGAVVSAENVFYWQAPVGLLHSGSIILLVAFLFAVVGIATPSPTAVGGEHLLEKADAAQGILRITRHPFLWSIVVWAAFHAGVNGDRASQVFFGAFFLVALAGTFSIDGKRTRKLGALYDTYKQQTSNVPFAAILSRRNRLALREIKWWLVLAAIAAWAIVLYGHFWLFGVSPFPGGWTPY